MVRLRRPRPEGYSLFVVTWRFTLCILGLLLTLVAGSGVRGRGEGKISHLCRQIEIPT